MSRSTIRSARPLVRNAALLVAATTLLAGCSAGQVAETARKVPSVPGTNAEIGDIAIRNALVTFPKEEKGYKAGSEVPIEVTFVNEGTQPDALVQVTSENAERVELRAGEDAPAPSTASPAPDRCEAVPSGSPTTVPGTTPPVSPSVTPSPTSSATPSPTGGAPASIAPIKVELRPGCLVRLDRTNQQLVLVGLKLEGGKETLAGGGSVTVTFAFERAGSITLTLPVGPPESPLPRESLPSEGDEGEH